MYASNAAAFSLVSKAKYASTFHGLNFEEWNEVLHQRCVLQGGTLNLLYCRYNADQDGKYCENVGVEHSFFSNSLPLALRRQGYGGHPSHAQFHSAYFCKQKKSTDSKTGLPSVALAKDGGRNRSYGA